MPKPVVVFRAAVAYYPFGMLMPGRYVQDTTTQCVTVEHEYGGIFNVRKDGLYGSRGKPKVGMPDQNGFAIGGSTLDVVELGGEDYYSVTAADEGDGMYQPLTLNAEFAHELVLDVPNMTGTWQAVIKQQVDGDWVTIAEENIVSTGQKVIECTPTLIVLLLSEDFSDSANAFNTPYPTRALILVDDCPLELLVPDTEN